MLLFRRDSSKPAAATERSTIPHSPTKTGVMRADRYWIIKTPRAPGFDHPYIPHCLVHPVSSDEIKFDIWRQAPLLANMMNRQGFDDRWLGRRVNDEVELFLDEGDEEYGLLKAALEEKGLVVRVHVVQAEKSRRPKVTYKAVQGEGEKTLFNEIVRNFAVFVQETEYQRDVVLEYGFVADVPGPRKRLALARVDREAFALGREGATIPARNLYQPPGGEVEEWKVLGEVRKGEVKFWCGEEITKLYFDSLGRVGDTAFVDYVQENEEAEKVEKRRDKQAAKKHRRMMTESSATTPSESSFGSRFTDEEEVVKARQRAKQNEKRKKQQQRRREDAEKPGKGSTVFIALKGSSDSEDSKSDGSEGKFWNFKHKLQDGVVVEDSKGRYQAARAVENMEESDEEVPKPRVKLPKRDQAQDAKRRKDSVKDSDDGEDEKGPLVVATMDELRPYLGLGNRIMVMNPVDESDITKGFQYLGRGL